MSGAWRGGGEPAGHGPRTAAEAGGGRRVEGESTMTMAGDPVGSVRHGWETAGETHVRLALCDTCDGSRMCVICVCAVLAADVCVSRHMSAVLAPAVSPSVSEPGPVVGLPHGRAEVPRGTHRQARRQGKRRSLAPLPTPPTSPFHLQSLTPRTSTCFPLGLCLPSRPPLPFPTSLSACSASGGSLRPTFSLWRARKAWATADR